MRDEEIVRAESILGERKKRAYIFTGDEQVRKNVLRLEHYASARSYKQYHLSSWNYEIVKK